MTRYSKKSKRDPNSERLNRETFFERLGFNRNFNLIFKNFEEQEIEKHCCYLVILDHDLVTLVKKIKEKGWKVGQDIGILAYNDSPLKEVLLDGITVMSTDHFIMGQRLANMLKENEVSKLENPFVLINRKSL